MLVDQVREDSLDVGDAGGLGVLVVGVDLCGDDVVLLKHQDLLHQPVPVEHVLQLLRGHVLAVAQDDQVLLAAGEVEEILLVHVAAVAGAEPAVLCENLRRLLRILVVSHHDGRALHLDLPVHDPHLAAVHQLSHGSGLVRPSPDGGGDFGGALGHAVALGHLDAQLGEAGLQLRGQVSAAADDLGEAFPQNLLLDVVQGAVRLLPGDDHDPVVQGLGNHGDGAEAGGFKQAHVLHQLRHIPVQAQDVAVAHGEEDVAVDAEYMVNGQDV